MAQIVFSDTKLPRGIVIGIDLQHVMPVEGATIFHQCDFTSHDTQARILEKLGNQKADLVLSDMAPAASGVKSLDHDKIIELCSSVVRFSTVVLDHGGSVLCKIWMGGKQHLLENAMKKLFVDVKAVKPPASRADSAELYLLGKGYKGLPQ